MKKNNAKRQRDFFISYTSVDRKWAEWIASVLESDDHTTTIQSWDFGPGCNFVLEMHNALLACRRVVLVYSPAYFKSLYAQAEWIAALVKNISGDQRVLLPVRVEPCAPGGLLQSIVFVDLVGVQNDTEARQRIIMAARPPIVDRRAPIRFPGITQGISRSAIDIARDLRDVLKTTLVTFNAQCAARNKLYDSMRKRLKVRDQLEFEDFFHKYFAKMSDVEQRQHEIIRGYSQNVLKDYNTRALNLCKELIDAESDAVDLDESVPSLVELHEHLSLWLGKFKIAIRFKSTCLVYVGPAEGMGFPSSIDQELDDLIASNGTYVRRPRRSRNRFREG